MKQLLLLSFILFAACSAGRSRLEEPSGEYPLGVTQQTWFPPSVTALAGPELPDAITEPAEGPVAMPRRASPAPIGADNLVYVPEAAESPARAASLSLTQEGRLSWLNGEADASRQKLQTAIQIWGGNPYAHYYLGLLELEAGRYSQASRYARSATRALGHIPFWNARAYLLMARAEEKRGNMEEAFHARTKAAELDPRVELR